MNSWVKIIIAIVLSYGMLNVARLNSRGQPEKFNHTENGYSFEMTSVPKGIEDKTETITVMVTPAPANVIFRSILKGTGNSDDLTSYASQVMAASTNSAGLYSIEVTAGVKNGRLFYYYQAVDAESNVLATFVSPEAGPFNFRYIGHVPIYVLGPHLIFIFATFFTVMMVLVNSVPLILGKSSDTFTVAKYLFWSTVVLFLGGYPFGIPMNWYAFGGFWEGVPFGTDATDNKTQLLLVYFIYATAATWGSYKQGKSGRDLYSVKGTGWLGLSAMIVTLWIYLIPHSIQFSKLVTYSVCYGFTGLVALIYILGYVKAKARV